MSDQLLTPFKAKFILSVKTTAKNFFEDSDSVSLKEKYKPLADNLGNVDMEKFIKYYQLSSQTYKDYKVKCNFTKQDTIKDKPKTNFAGKTIKE